MSDMSSYDELIKLKELMDMGIISEDEFNAKKAQILGLDNSSTTVTKETSEENSELFACPGCGKNVSRKASTCPGCGYPINEFVSKQKKIEKQKNEKEKEDRKNSEEYTELIQETTFKIGSKDISVSKNQIILSTVIHEFDKVYEEVMLGVVSAFSHNALFR